MRKISPVLLALLLMAACNEVDLKSQRIINTLSVDGLSNDWQDYKISYSDDFDLAYAMANDDSSLYIMIRLKDQRRLQMMAMRGFTLWLNDGKDSNANFGIRYMVPVSMRPRGKIRPGERKESRDVPVNSKYFSLVGKNKEQMDWSLVTFPQIKAAIDFREGDYCLEYRIPRNCGEDLPFDFATVNADQIEIGFELAGLKREGMRDGKRDNFDGGHGGKRSGGMSGSGGRNGQSKRAGKAGPRMEEKSIWFDVTLAEKN